MSKLGSNWEVGVVQCYFDEGLQIVESDWITINEIKNKNNNYNYRSFSKIVDFINYDDDNGKQYYIIEIHKYELNSWWDEMEKVFIGNIKIDPRTKDVNEYYECDLIPKLPKYVQKALLEWFET